MPSTLDKLSLDKTVLFFIFLLVTEVLVNLKIIYLCQLFTFITNLNN